MPRISTPSQAINTRPEATVYVDTLELFVRKLPSGFWNAIREAQGEPPIINKIVRPISDTAEFVPGYVVAIQQPRLETLTVLAEWEQAHSTKVHRFDVAYDISPRPDETAAELDLWLSRSALLKWRRGIFYRHSATEYSVEKPTTRNMARYSDRPGKITGEIDIVHLELRFLRSDSVRRSGVESVADLLKLNPRDLFKRQVRLVDAEAIVRREQNTIRATLKAERESHARENGNQHVERYRAGLKQRLERNWRRNNLHTAEGFKDMFPQEIARMRPISPHVLNIPTKLSHFTSSPIEQSMEFPNDRVTSPLITGGEDHMPIKRDRNNPGLGSAADQRHDWGWKLGDPLPPYPPIPETPKRKRVRLPPKKTKPEPKPKFERYEKVPATYEHSGERTFLLRDRLTGEILDPDDLK